jgi:hypothetical protein
VTARACAAALAVAALAMLAWPRRFAEAPRRLVCTGAMRVDGELRCDGEAPRTIGELCGDARTDAIATGDAIDRAVACGCTAPRCGRARMIPEELALLGVAVDVNAASAVELASLPGVGPTIAERIVAGRPYEDVDALERVRGIGPRTLARMRPRVRLR